MTMLNTIPAQAAGRQPRAIVRINGSPVVGWISWEVTQNTFYEADTFRVSFAVSALPQDKGAQWFSQQAELFAEILAGFPANPAAPTPNELDSLIYGRVDEIDFDPVSTIITLTGRDLTAVFIDARAQASSWQATTASRIAFDLALAHGFDPIVTETTTPVGVYYQREQVKLVANQSEWDVLAWLAREEGFVCYVKGFELHFEPAPDQGGDPYVIQWQDNQANVGGLHFSRALTVAKGVTVTVRAASLKGKVPVVESYPGKAKSIQAGKASPFGGTQNYYFTAPAGSTPERCAKLAQDRYREIIAHEMRMHARLPADNLLQATSAIRVQGTGTAWDQTYFPRSVTRMMSMDEGYVMTFEAKNQNPATVAAQAS